MDMQIFENAEFGVVRTVEQDGKVMFCGKDVATALGYSNTKDALSRHCKSDGVVNRYPIVDQLGREQQARFITEGDLYRLVASSKLPSAQKFESWVFDEVLPSIRKQGAYVYSDGTEDAAVIVARGLYAAQAIIEEKDAEIERLRPKALLGEAVEPSKASYTVTEAVRYVAQVAPAVRRQQVFDMLRGAHMMVRGGTAPTRAGIDTGRMVAVMHEFVTDDGRTLSRQQGRLTGKGLAWLLSRFVEGGAA